jgi:hypothetical protein
MLISMKGHAQNMLSCTTRIYANNHQFPAEVNWRSIFLQWHSPVYGGVDGLQNKKERKKVREVGILKKDPDAIKEQIRKLEMMSVWSSPFPGLF